MKTAEEVAEEITVYFVQVDDLERKRFKNHVLGIVTAFAEDQIAEQIRLLAKERDEFGEKETQLKVALEEAVQTCRNYVSSAAGLVERNAKLEAVVKAARLLIYPPRTVYSANSKKMALRDALLALEDPSDKA